MKPSIDTLMEEIKPVVGEKILFACRKKSKSIGFLGYLG